MLYASCEKPFDLLCYRIHRKCPKVNDFCAFDIKDVALNGTKHILHDYSPEVDEYLTIHCCQPESGMIADIQSTAERAKMAELLKYATIIISSLPLLVMYPFFQKYFDAGIMAGSIKG